MILPDIVNASFEAGAGLAVLHHCFKLYEHKQARGVSTAAVLFFTAWGVWNLYYYPHLGQFWSFAGGIFITMANLAYLAMLVHYTRNRITIQQAVLGEIDLAQLDRAIQGARHG